MNIGKHLLRGLLGAVCSIAASGLSFAADSPSPTLALSAGAAFKPHVQAAFFGGLWAPSSDLDSDGFQVKGGYVYVHYNFSTGQSASGSANGQLNSANAQVGYQLVRYGVATSFFVGPDYQDFSVNPSAAANRKLSQKLGAIFAGRVARPGTPVIPASIEGNYSTANTTYWSSAKVGYNFGSITVGPQLTMLGNVAFDEGRYGGYASYTFAQGASVQVGLGYSRPWRRTATPGVPSGDGMYGEISFVLLNY